MIILSPIENIITHVRKNGSSIDTVLFGEMCLMSGASGGLFIEIAQDEASFWMALEELEDACMETLAAQTR